MDSASGDPVGAVTWMIRGQWVTLSIRAAVELGVFDRLEAPTSVADLAVEIGCDPGALARLVRVLVDLGLVEFSGVAPGPGDEVSLTAGGGTLTRGHASGLRELALMQSTLANLASWQRLADAVRTGDAVFEKVNGIDPWQFLASNPEHEAIFNAAMARRGSDQAAAINAVCNLSGVRLVVDVGGGRGAMLAALLTTRPGLRGVVADRPEVAAAAQGFLADAGLADRAGAAAVDFFQSVPAEADAYVLANVLHDWTDGEAIRILRTIHASMKPSARLWVVEHVLDAPGRGFEVLRDVHLVDLHMLVMFGARERTATEYDALFLPSGFEAGRLQTTDGEWDVIETRPR
jgi:hypothetical protein